VFESGLQEFDLKNVIYILSFPCKS